MALLTIPKDLSANKLPTPALSQGGSTTQPMAPKMGVQAQYPTANISPTPTTLPKGFAVPGMTYAQYEASQGFPQNSSANTPNPSNPPATQPAPQAGSNFPFTPNTGIFGQLIAGAANTANQPSQQFLDAYQKYQEANKALAQSRSDEAAALGGIQSTPIPLEFQQGRSQVVQGQYQAQQAALASEAQGAASVLGATTAQQQAQQSGLLGAAGLSVPTQVPYGAQYLSPVTGQSVQPGGTPYGTGPAAAANVQSIQDQTKQVNDWSAARGSASNLENQLTTFIQQNGINPSDFNAVNRFLQTIGAQTSSPQYQTFSNLVNDLASVYAQILTPAGGSQTDMVRTIAQSLLNATASGQSITTVLQGLGQQAQNKISGVQQNIQNLQSGQNPNQSQGGFSGTPLFGSFFSTST